MSANAYREIPRLVLTGCIVGLFGYALLTHYGNGVEETLKNSFMIAVGFWLGSSKGGSDTAAKNADTVAAQAAQATDTASGTPRAVEVVNTPASPVPTKDAAP